ncbi:MAG: phenylacetate--CoA ligase family protein [Candidatus Saccharicenans sp.]
MIDINYKLNNIIFNSNHFIRDMTINLYGYFLAKKRFGKTFKKYYNFLQESQWWDLKKLQEFQREKLKELIDIAYNNVPYYRKLFSEYGLTPSDINTIEDLNKLPSLNKNIIRENIKELLNKKINRAEILKRYSSGTTGQKLEYYLPKELAYGINYAQLYRFYKWANIKLGDRRVTIGGRIFTFKPPYWVFNKAENQLLLSIHHLNENTVDEYIEKIKNFRPVFIQGHPSGLYFLAKRISYLNMSIPVKAIFTTGETLFDYQRESIKKAFDCDVFESYGLGESVIMAFECEMHSGFHEASEYGILEFEKDSSSLYRVIGTSLWNYAMPFIRYEIEDLVEISDNWNCTCGRGLPIKIKRVIGRIDDILISDEGQTVFPVTIRMSIKPVLKPFDNYQLQQIGKGEYIFLFTGDLDRETRMIILRILKNILGRNSKIQIEPVDKIMSQSGKVRNILNLYKKVKNE